MAANIHTISRKRRLPGAAGVDDARCAARSKVVEGLSITGSAGSR